jgi:hypothetical protein
VKDTDEGADEVVRFRIRTQIATADGALNQIEKYALNKAACAFNEAHGAARYRIHGGKDELFVGHMVDEQKHPRAESVERRHRGGEAPASRRQLFDFATVDRLNQSVAGRKVTIKRAWADAGLAGDVVKCSSGSIPAKDEPRNLEDALAVALRIRTQFAKRRRG